MGRISTNMLKTTYYIVFELWLGDLGGGLGKQAFPLDYVVKKKKKQE